MPFREHVDSFTPEQLAMTAALNPAIRELGGPASDDIAREMAERVLRRASDGIFSEAEFKTGGPRERPGPPYLSSVADFPTGTNLVGRHSNSMEAYRGYSISVKDHGLYFRVYVSPNSSWDPILHCDHFDCRGTREEALAEARTEVDKLLDYGLKK